MGKLYLIRHGQASFGAEDYDRLSELGFKQSARIADHFSKVPSRLIRGSMRRHLETAETAFAARDVSEDAGWNEFDHREVLRVHRPEIENREEAMKLLMAQANPGKFMEEEFREAMRKWINGRGEYQESFVQFRSRVLDALSRLFSEAERSTEREFAVVSSGGVISLLMTHFLELEAERMISFNLGIANASVTAFLFSRGRVSLDYYNNYSHLGPDLLSFR
jgi:broad specificity phosphatase PhoE